MLNINIGGAEKVDHIKIRDYLVKKYRPQKFSVPYVSDQDEAYHPLGPKERSELFDLFLSLDLEDAIKLWSTSDTLLEIRREASKYKSIERVYMGPLEDPVTDSNKHNFTRLMLENIKNSLATRNRRRIIKRELVKFIEKRNKFKRSNVSVLSIGAGSARAVIEATEILKNKGHKLRLNLVDHDVEALTAAGKLAREKKVLSSLNVIEAKFYHLSKYLSKDKKVDFVEIVGLLDYLNDRTIKFLLTSVGEYLSEDGVFLISNVIPNEEQYFLHNIVGWPQMIYREIDDLLFLARESGFKNCELIHEPTGCVGLIRVGR